MSCSSRFASDLSNATSFEPVLTGTCTTPESPWEVIEDPAPRGTGDETGGVPNGIVVPDDPGTEGAVSEGSGTEGRGSEGRGSEGTGSEGDGGTLTGGAVIGGVVIGGAVTEGAVIGGTVSVGSAAQTDISWTI